MYVRRYIPLCTIHSQCMCVCEAVHTTMHYIHTLMIVQYLLKGMQSALLPSLRDGSMDHLTHLLHTTTSMQNDSHTHTHTCTHTHTHTHTLTLTLTHTHSHSHTDLSPAQVLEGSLFPVLCRPLHEHLLVRHNDGHQCGLQTVPVHIGLRHQTACHVHVLYLLWSYVLPLGVREGGGGECGG